MKKHKIIEIQGKRHYYVRLDSKNRFVVVDPPNDYLYLKTLREVFNKYRGRATFTMFDPDVDPDIYVAEDIYTRMLKRNPKLQILVDTFEIEIIS